ncbi:MAG TPA: ATP-binding protein [Candidatus Dormibacteraeota bacterium]|nr:ATP-binding protein [Candidatus Dormibacteraeota bacterium]
MTPAALGQLISIAAACGLGGVAVGWALARRAAADALPAVPPRPDAEANGQVEGDGERRLQEVLARLPAAALLVDPMGRVLQANGAATEILGIPAQLAPGRALIELVHSYELDRIVHRALEGEVAETVVVFRKLPSERTLAVLAFPIAGGDAIVLARDETRLVRLERVRREFVANVSHELRTPLASLKLAVETLLESDDEEARSIFLPQMRQEVERMIALTEDLLELARAESGRMVLRIDDVDLAALAREVVKSFERRAREQGVTLRIEAEERVRARGDRDRLAQVLVNLVDNALRYTPSGGEIAIGAACRDGEAMLTVRDTGAGIPFADLPHVFERFYVVDRSRQRGASGTGLGLAIVKHLVEAHGGTVTAESDLGSGSTFTCRWPVAPPP